MQELAFLDATAQANLVRSKEVSATELIEFSITRIEKLNPVLNAIITRLYDEARDAAKHVDPHAPLAGVPFVLKDLVAECAETPISEGSEFLGNYVSNHDSELVQRYRQAGLIVVAKSNTPEFAPSCFGLGWGTGRGMSGT